MLVIPKPDLIQNPPSVAGRTCFGVLDHGAYGSILQPAVTLGTVADMEKVLAAGDLGYDMQPKRGPIIFAF